MLQKNNKLKSCSPPPHQYIGQTDFASVWSDENLYNCVIDSFVFFPHLTEQASFGGRRAGEMSRYKTFEPAETHMWAACTLKCAHTHTHKPTNYFWSVAANVCVHQCVHWLFLSHLFLCHLHLRKQRKIALSGTTVAQLHLAECWRRYGAMYYSSQPQQALPGPQTTRPM